MTKSKIYEALTVIFHDVFVRDDIQLTPELSAKDVEGWDSLKMIEIIISTEKHFNFKMRSQDVDRLQCVDDLVKLIETSGHLGHDRSASAGATNA